MILINFFHPQRQDHYNVWPDTEFSHLSHDGFVSGTRPSLLLLLVNLSQMMMMMHLSKRKINDLFDSWSEGLKLYRLFEELLSFWHEFWIELFLASCWCVFSHCLLMSVLFALLVWCLLHCVTFQVAIQFSVGFLSVAPFPILFYHCDYYCVDSWRSVSWSYICCRGSTFLRGLELGLDSVGLVCWLGSIDICLS